MHFSKEPLFDASDKAWMGQTLAKLESMAAEEIAKHPEKREEILERLRWASRRFVENVAHEKRKRFFLAALAMSALGFLVMWIGDAVGVRLLFAFGGCLTFSGIITALLNIPLRPQS